MQLCFFSDAKADNFLPLTLTRPVFELRLGILTIKEKWESHLKSIFTDGTFSYYLKELFKVSEINNAENCIWINSRYLPSKDLVDSILDLSEGEVLLSVTGEVIATLLDGKKSSEIANSNAFDSAHSESKTFSSETLSIAHLWDLLSLNSSEIDRDISLLNPSSFTNREGLAHCLIENADQIFISEEATVEPGCILIASAGPIYIGANATIEAGSILKGPVAICEGATIKMQARISDGTTVGPVCKVGGEVSNCIFHSFSNKGHDGFTGNSIFGQWCNLGADTNTSNLKNNYSEVKLFDWKTKKPATKGVQFLGTVMGDHSKTAINTMLNTGTICGVSSNIFSSGFPPKYIHSFSWLGTDDTQKYVFEKAIDAMNAMMGRRRVTLTDSYEKMMRVIFDAEN